MLMHMNVYCSSFSGSGTIKRIGMPSGPSENIGKMITNFIYRPIILLLQVVRNTLQLRRRRDKQFQVYTIQDFSLVIHFKRRAREQRNLEGSRVRVLLKRGTGSGERGKGKGSLGTSCQRKPP